MRALHLKASHRARLFRELADQGVGEGHLGRVFRLLDQGHAAAKRAHLDELASQFERGQQALLDAFRESGRFLAWELELISLGLTAGDIRAIYLRLAEHYHQVERLRQDLHRHGWLPLAVVIVAGVALPLGAYLDGSLGVPLAAALMVLPMALLGGGYWLARRLVDAAQKGCLARWFIDGCYRLPGVGRLLTCCQTYHYFSNLSLCLHGGLSLQQGLQLSAQRLPYSPCRQLFVAVHESVASGGRLSDALRHSGILAGIPLAPVAEGTGARDAQQMLTAATHAAFQKWVEYCGKWLPRVSLLVLPLVLVIDLLVLL